jgi:hypothetical protein
MLSGEERDDTEHTQPRDVHAYTTHFQPYMVCLIIVTKRLHKSVVRGSGFVRAAGTVRS